VGGVGERGGIFLDRFGIGLAILRPPWSGRALHPLAERGRWSLVSLPAHLRDVMRGWSRGPTP